MLCVVYVCMYVCVCVYVCACLQLLASLQDVLQVGLDSEGSPLRYDQAARAELLFGMRWTYLYMQKTATAAQAQARAGGTLHELEAVQGVLDAFFNYVVLWQQVDRDAYLQEGQAQFVEARAWVDRLLALVAPGDRGAALYFEYKLHEMRAMLHRQREDVPRMLAAFEDTVAVWNRMHEVVCLLTRSGFEGKGRGGEGRVYIYVPVVPTSS